jgi:thioredoxin-like negative regulator of GroEL
MQSLSNNHPNKEYGIASLPTVIAIKDGKVVGKFVGAQREEKVTEFVATHA